MDLLPEAASPEREVEVADTLPFDHPVGSDDVVADLQGHDLDRDAVLVEPAWYTARPLVNVSENLHLSQVALQ